MNKLRFSYLAYIHSPVYTVRNIKYTSVTAYTIRTSEMCSRPFYFFSLPSATFVYNNILRSRLMGALVRDASVYIYTRIIYALAKKRIPRRYFPLEKRSHCRDTERVSTSPATTTTPSRRSRIVVVFAYTRPSSPVPLHTPTQLSAPRFSSRTSGHAAKAVYTLPAYRTVRCSPRV